MSSEFTVSDLEEAHGIVAQFCTFCAASPLTRKPNAGASASAASATGAAAKPVLPRIWEPAVQQCVTDPDLVLYLLTDAQHIRAQAAETVR